MRVYNLKNILFGVGIGMVLTSVLNISFGDKELTPQDIKNEAQKHNLIVISPNELIDKKSDSKSEDNTLVPKDNSEVENRTDIFVEINIEKGSNSEKIAELLKDNSLINDESSFINELYKQNKSNIIQYGKFKIKKGIEIDELIKIITTVQK